MSSLHVLFLADTTHPAGAVADHINAITAGNKLVWHVLNPLVCKTIDKMDFSLFAAIGIHYSIKPYNNYYLSPALKKKIAAFSGVKFLFLQDEYQRVNQVQEYLATLDFNLLFTLVNQQTLAKAYPDPRLSTLKKVTVLTGYASKAMKNYPAPPIAERTIDVSYRARRCDYWLGSLAYEKQFIATEFITRTQGEQLRLDISLEEAYRLYGKHWLQLLSNSKAVLGTESGASIWDFDGHIEQRVNHYLRHHNNAVFSDVYEHALKPDDGEIMYNCISPRVFEAAATKTPMIMFPGDYSGVCKPDIHYIVLEKDFSNLKEVLERLKDNAFLQQLADRCFAELIAADCYAETVFTKLIEEEISQLITQKQSALTKEYVHRTINDLHYQYRYINKVRKCMCEMGFILSNFFKLLFDSKYSARQRFDRLWRGGKRYITYLTRRLTHNGNK